MFYDLLVHVDLPDESRFVMALGNINNYLAALNGEPCTVVLLANGGASSPGKTTRKPKPLRNWLRPGFPSACAPTP
jgi:intracellular sulfur oxidation DsrE/DsrF family protein